MDGWTDGWMDRERREREHEVAWLKEVRECLGGVGRDD